MNNTYVILLILFISHACNVEEEKSISPRESVFTTPISQPCNLDTLKIINNTGLDKVLSLIEKEKLDTYKNKLDIPKVLLSCLANNSKDSFNISGVKDKFQLDTVISDIEFYQEIPCRRILFLGSNQTYTLLVYENCCIPYHYMVNAVISQHENSIQYLWVGSMNLIDFFDHKNESPEKQKSLFSSKESAIEMIKYYQENNLSLHYRDSLFF